MLHWTSLTVGGTSCQLVVAVLQHVQEPRDLAAAGCACRSWSAAAREPGLWRRLYLVRRPVRGHAILFSRVCYSAMAYLPLLLSLALRGHPLLGRRRQNGKRGWSDSARWVVRMGSANTAMPLLK